MIRAFLATRLLVAFVIGLALGIAVDLLALSAFYKTRQVEGAGVLLFLLIALLAFFVVLPALLLILRQSSRQSGPAFWKGLLCAMFSIVTATLWVSLEFGVVIPRLLAAVSAHAFMIYGVPTAFLFWLTTRPSHGPPTSRGTGRFSHGGLTRPQANLVLLALPISLFAWAMFARGFFLKAALNH